MSGPVWRDGWEAYEPPADAPPREDTDDEQIDALLRRHGWDGQMDRAPALRALIGQLQRRATEQAVVQADRRYEAAFTAAKRGAGGKAKQEEKGEETLINVAVAIVDTLAAYLPVTTSNVMNHWPKEGGKRPTAKTIRKHLRELGYLQKSGDSRE